MATGRREPCHRNPTYPKEPPTRGRVRRSRPDVGEWFPNYRIPVATGIIETPPCNATKIPPPRTPNVIPMPREESGVVSFPPPPSTKTRGMHLRLGVGACLCFYFPLFLEGPKIEGDKGGEGSLVGRGYPPKCAICPLTLPEHLYYSIHSSNTNPTISRRNQTPREAPETQPEDSTPKPIPTALLTGPAAQATVAISSPHRVPCPFPNHQAMDGPSTFYSASGLSIDALADTSPLIRAFTPRRLNPRRGYSRVY